MIFKEIIQWGIIEVFLWPLWVPSNLRRFFNQNYVSYILGVPGQANQTLSEVRRCDLVIGLLSQSQGWLDTGQKQRGVGPPEPSHPIASPIGPCGCWCCWALVCSPNTATAPPGTGHLPRSPDPGLPLCPAAVLLGRHSLLPAPVSPVPGLNVQTVCPGTLHHLIPVPCSWKALPLPGLRVKLSQHRTRCRPWADSVSHPFQVGLGKQLLGLSWT